MFQQTVWCIASLLSIRRTERFGTRNELLYIHLKWLHKEPTQKRLLFEFVIHMMIYTYGKFVPVMLRLNNTFLIMRVFYHATLSVNIRIILSYKGVTQQPQFNT